MPNKPKYDWKYNLAFFKDSEIIKAEVMSEKITQLIKRIPGKPTVFEIGVGNGLFLKRIQNAGIPCEGVDVDKRLCEYLIEGDHLTVHAGGIERFKVSNRFDVVYSADVIEHFENPNVFMSQARRLLKPDGFLFINTPDLDCSNNCDPKWHHFKTRHPWEHACIISPKALLSLSAKHKFSIISIERTPMFGSFQALMQRIS
jgi:2-polyprenyl-3-methyl-5-hydroxy-6-metoxy-1,4-benzoquinol methylase